MIVMSSVSALQLPLLRLRRIADHHGDVTLGPDWLRDGETLTDGDLVETVGLLHRQTGGDTDRSVTVTVSV